MAKVILKTIGNIVYTGDYISQSATDINITNVESDNIEENIQLQEVKKINAGMLFLKNNIIWYTIK